jgi:molybdopterin-guanine dinucleotide biosynthesis protein A
MSPASAFRPAAVTAVVLAGGAGTRMGGVDKARLQYRGRPFIEHIVERLQPQAARLIINSDQPDCYRPLGLTVVSDPWPQRRGPLAGILAGLDASATPFTLFVPCDCPLPPLQLASRLHHALMTECSDIAYAITAAGDHYLFALIRTTLREDLRAHLAAPGNGAVKRWYVGLHCTRVGFDDQPDCFLNVNRPADLTQLP